MTIKIDIEINEDDAEKLRHGAGTEYPLDEEIFLRTVGGYISMLELILLAFNRFGRKFHISIEGLPEDHEVKPCIMRAAFMQDAIRPVRQEPERPVKR